jgi:pilus assembly protein CpaF
MADVNQSDEILMTDCVDAWPIIVFAKQLKDNTRKIMEIFEATGQKDGKVVGHTLYKFNVEDTVRDGRGHITKVIGRHCRMGTISPRLYSRLRDNGAPEQLLQRLFPGAVGEEVA